MFDILENKKIIDISYTVIPGESPDRPFAIQKALLADRAFRYDILKTHTHVGTHVEVGAHFYDGGKTITDYPLDTFYGPAILFPVKEMIVSAEHCEKEIGSIIESGDIVVIRNDSGVKMTKADMYEGKDDHVPRMTTEAAKWLANKQVKMLVLDFIRFGKDIEEGREFHDILMSKDVVFVEFVDNLDEISKQRFYLMSLPYKVEGLDSSFCRAIVIEDK
ncbi:MAG: cyclase family protein [Candidatus Hodarchaeota archaeon]